MKEKPADRFYIVSTLRTWAWESFAQRREFEGKVNIGVWAGLSALIGILLSKDVSVVRDLALVKWGSAFFTLALISLHIYYIHGLEIAQRRDRDSVHEYDRLLEAEFGPFLSESVKAAKEEDKARAGFHRNYSHVFEVGLTLLLGLCLIAVTLLK